MRYSNWIFALCAPKILAFSSTSSCLGRIRSGRNILCPSVFSCPSWYGYRANSILIYIIRTYATKWLNLLYLVESDLEFLLREVGKPYVKAFHGLRLASLIGHPQDVDMVQSDRIIPLSLLLPVFRVQWYRMLQTDQGYDKGWDSISFTNQSTFLR